jgi:hypothetical protein
MRDVTFDKDAASDTGSDTYITDHLHNGARDLILWRCFYYKVRLVHGDSQQIGQSN